ncbi:GTPase domain-containing protein [Bacillus sp. RO1]|uniref:GTPase domain-containing protein n=1 Tax=Bacillus sp. RO1 TaxID=2722703 RepID=UPI001456AECB|nr:GTPase domain-containing protein [Bacillus sp. RO1]NLP52432.1 hypothetical protein [Bacillus sp. RO1]
MWWIPAVAVGGFVAKKIIDSQKSTKHQYQYYPSTLERNFNRLGYELEHVDGSKIALIGLPGAGKSTLLHSLTKGKCIPKPFISQVTDATDWTVNEEVPLFHTYKETVFIDTPGYGTRKHPVSSYSYLPFYAFSKIIFVVRGKLRFEDQELFDMLILQGFEHKMIICRSSSETLTEEDILEVKKDLNKHLKYKYKAIPLVFISSRSGVGISTLKEWIVQV